MPNRALVIAHEIDGHACLVAARLVERGWVVDTHVVCPEYTEPGRAAPFPSVEGYDLVLPMGSIRSLTKIDEIGPWIHEELDLLRGCHEAGVAMLGICFGGQLLAQVLGGSVERAPEGEFGWCRIEGPDNPVGEGPWFQWHHDRFTPPAEADLLAKSDKANQLFRLGRTVGTQFHPEVNRAHVAAWLGVATDEYLAECGLDRYELLAECEVHEKANRRQTFRLVDWFLDEVAASGTSGTRRAPTG